MNFPSEGDSQIPVINLKPALARLGNDEALLRDLAGFYLEDGPSLLTEIENGLTSGDAEVVMRSAHSLKGLSANFDANRASALAQAVETCGRDGDLTGARDKFAALRSEIDLVIAALQRDVIRE